MSRSFAHDFSLDSAGIDLVSEEVDAFLGTVAFDRRSVLTARLALENVLLGMSKHLESQTVATLRQRTFLGRPYLSLSIPGERFDPNTLYKGSVWESSIMAASNIRLLFAYRGGRNQITLVCPRPPLSSIAQIAAAALLGALAANLGMMIPEQVRQTLLTSAVNPIFDTFIGLLSGLAGPMVFVSVAWGICGIGDVAALGRSGKSLIGTFLLTNLGALPIALPACMLLMPLSGITSGGGGAFLDNVVQMLLGLFPSNIVKPFYDGNTLQIIVLSAIMGTAILVLGDAGHHLQQLIKELNRLFSLLMDELCRFIPLLVFVMVIMQVWSGTFDSLLTSWLPFLLSVVLIVVYQFLQMVFLSRKLKVPPRRIIDTCKPATLIALTTASSSAAFGSMLSACEDGFDIDEQLASFGIPLGIVVCKPALVIMLTALMIFCAQAYGIGADAFWYARLALSSLFFAVAVPPVPGGMLACYTMLFTDLGIPLAALALATALDIILDYITTSSDVTSIILNVLHVKHILNDQSA